jgi:ribosomal protein L3 glutamine methyltransferase
MNLEQKIEVVANRLEIADLSYGHGTDNAWDEATWIVIYALGLDLVREVQSENFDWQSPIRKSDSVIIDSFVDRRVSSRTPFAYLCNETWFAGNKFYVDERAIIPRSYLSEWIPESFAPWVVSEDTHSILDLCTGSGCIAVSCALAFPQANVLASDISAQALEVARINVHGYGLEKRVKLNRGDCFGGINGEFDLILCNPPYVSNDRMDRLPPEYCHEPDNALRAGGDGLDFIVSMLSQVNKFLTRNGTLIVEAGSASVALEERFPEIPFTWLSTAYDETVVFIMNAEELCTYSHLFKEALNKS